MSAKTIYIVCRDGVEDTDILMCFDNNVSADKFKSDCIEFENHNPKPVYDQFAEDDAYEKALNQAAKNHPAGSYFSGYECDYFIEKRKLFGVKK